MLWHFFWVPLRLAKTRHPGGPWNVLPNFAAIAPLQQLPGSFEKKSVEPYSSALGALNRYHRGSQPRHSSQHVQMSVPHCRSRLETDVQNISGRHSTRCGMPINLVWSKWRGQAATHCSMTRKQVFLDRQGRHLSHGKGGDGKLSDVFTGRRSRKRTTRAGTRDSASILLDRDVTW